MPLKLKLATMKPCCANLNNPDFVSANSPQTTFYASLPTPKNAGSRNKATNPKKCQEKKKSYQPQKMPEEEMKVTLQAT